MKIGCLLISLTFLVSAADVFALSNSAPIKVVSIETRESGYHALNVTGTIPNEDCTLNDRAIILESSEGGKTMLSVALSALVASKNIVVQVSGCTIIDPAQTQHTAPKVTKLLIFN